jgi:glutathione synthase
MDGKLFKFLFLMDPLKQKGHAVYWIQPETLYLLNDQVMGEPSILESVSPFGLGQAKEQNLSDFDCLLIRNDPPFDMNYYHLMLILDYLPPRVIQINPPRALRDLNEKISGLRLPHFSPPSITTKNWRQMLKFAKERGEIVLKPLGECSGRGVEKISAEDPHLEQHLKAKMGEGKDALYLTAQAFLPAIYEGDKRVFFVDGECLGIVNRIPADGSFMGNIHQGARCEAATLSDNEKEIVKAIAAFLESHGVFMAGIDLIGGKITEINVTSPSAVRQINKVSGLQIQKRIVEKILTYVAREQSKILQ